MNQNLSNIEVTILGRDYLVACKPEEEQDLHEAVRHLNRLIDETKRSSATTDNEKVCVITALNLASQLLQMRRVWEEKATRLAHLVETGYQPSGSGRQHDSESLEITL